MRIGVDISNIVDPVTGIGRYTQQMCMALAKIEGFTLFLYKPNNTSSDTIERQLKESAKKSIMHDLKRQVWIECILPFLVKK